MEFYLQAFLFFLISVYLYHHFHSFKRNNSNKSNGFKVYPIVGTLPEFIKNRHRHLDWLTENIARSPTHTAVFHRLGNSPGIMTANPSNVEHMLKSNFDNYPKGDRFISAFEDFFGRGLIVSNGEAWRLQRKALANALNARFLKHFITQNVIMADIETKLVPVLEEASRSGMATDLQDIFDRFTFDNALKILFNVEFGCLAGDDKLMLVYKEVSEIIAGRLRSPFPFLWKINRLLNVGSERRLRKSIAAFHKIADDFVRLQIEPEGLLSLFVGNNEYSPEYLRDLVTGFILAGQDTSSSALTWFFWVLSSQPDVEEKILKEIGESRRRSQKSAGDAFSSNELRDMHYLHAAISESMRLYPPVPVDIRTCLNDDVLPDGTFVGKNWFISYHAYTMGRLESIWGKSCLEYRPERWLEHGVFRQESPFRYPVFHAGPRMCLGKDMAYVQLKLVAATVIERFVISAEGKDRCPKHSMSFTLRMEEGLSVTVKKRHQ